MKKVPFLYNAEPVVTDVKPVHSRGMYDVYVGSLEEDALPVYVIMNRNTGVVEFTDTRMPVVNEWLDHFSPEAAIDASDLGQMDLNLVARN